MTRTPAARYGTAAVALLLAGLWSTGSVLTTGCARATRPQLSLGCSGFDPDCEARPATAVTAADGETRRRVQIDTEPTSAAIYFNGRFIGYSPLKYDIGFSSTDRAISLIAVPLYPGQAQQEQLIAIPPLPTRVSFFMNNPAADAADSDEPQDRPPASVQP
jgi:hypothetical protein